MVNNEKAKYIDSMKVKGYGMNIWIKGDNHYRTLNDWVVTVMENDKTENKWASGLQLCFSSKDMQWMQLPNTKKDGRNEITFWLTLEEGKNLRNFLTKWLERKPAESKEASA